MPIMSNATPLFFGPDAAGSYSAGQVAARGSDVRAYIVLASIALYEATQLRSTEGVQLALAAAAAVLAGLIAWAVVRPEAYRCRRIPVVALVRLALAAKVLFDDSFVLADPAPGGPSSEAQAGGLVSSPRKEAAHFVLLLAYESGALLLSQATWTLELPPLLAAAVQAAGVALVSTGNRAICAAPYLQRPLSRKLLTGMYRVLQPAVATLEPLLAAVGVSHVNNPERQCLCVLSVLQFWGGLVLPLLLTTRSQLFSYLEWRRARMGQQRAQRRQQRGTSLAASAQQRAAAAAAAVAAVVVGTASGGGSGSGGSGGSSKSMSPQSVTTGGSGGRGSSSSGRSSLSSDSLDRLEEQMAGMHGLPPRLSLAQLLKPARRGGKPHPEDWQYERAARLMADLHLSWLQLALLAVVLCQMALWHATLYPAIVA